MCVCLSVQVLYRKQGHSQGTLYTTSRRYIDLPLPSEGNYVVEVRAHTEGGDGAVAQIQITGGYLHLSHLSICQSGRKRLNLWVESCLPGRLADLISRCGRRWPLRLA